MTKKEFIAYISKQHGLNKVASERIIDIFISSSIDVLGSGEEILLVGFGRFSVLQTSAKIGHNPRTGEKMQIPSY